MASPFLVQCVNAAHAANSRRAFAVAADWCRQALHLAPELPEAWYHLGIALAGLGRRSEAITALERAAAKTQNSADAQNNIGLQLLEMGAFVEADRCLERALRLAPDYAYAHSNLGKLRVKEKRWREAEASFRKALALEPDLAPAYVNLTGVLNAKHDYAAAEAACRKAIELDPRSPDAWRNRANALAGLKDYAAAAECGDRCLALDPSAKFVRGATLHNRMKICAWSGFDDALARILQGIRNGENASYPFPLLALTTDLAVQRQAAEAYVADEFPARDDLGPIPRRKGGRIRIGYYSADFRNHAVSILMAEVFELHDRDRFELIAFAFGRESEDEMRRRLRVAFDAFIDVRDKSDREVAMLSRELGIDIAVDLNGFTEGCRMGIFALRAAPIQVSYLGYLGTAGAPYIDYLIADATMVPAASRPHYSEKIAYVPSFQANDSKRPIEERRFTREELGLPTSGTVFCNFNNTYKITPPIFDAWMRILARVEGSVLFLYADNRSAVENLKSAAQSRGIASERLVFGERLAAPEYLARYRAADLFLDTHPYNGGTTASDALWAGIPLLTLMGESCASRMAASLLEAIGLPEFVTRSLEEYETRAVELGTARVLLDASKQRLAQNRHTMPLFDATTFTRNLERVYRAMFERHQANLPPDHLELSSERPLP